MPATRRRLGVFSPLYSGSARGSARRGKIQNLSGISSLPTVGRSASLSSSLTFVESEGEQHTPISQSYAPDSTKSGANTDDDGSSTSSDSDFEEDSKIKYSVWGRFEQAMNSLHTSAKLVPTIQSAVDDVRSCFGQLETARTNRQEYDQIISSLTNTAEVWGQLMADFRSDGLTEATLDIERKIKKEIETVTKLRNLSKKKQLLRAVDHENDLVRRYRRIGGLFRRIQMETSKQQLHTAREDSANTLMKNLKPAQHARYNSNEHAIYRRACTENTRREVFDEIYKWMDSPGTPNIYWMNGMAGTGKTTIAYTLAEQLESKKPSRLGASFFCTTSEGCRDAGRIIPTIAYQLACGWKPFKTILHEVLQNIPDIATFGLSDQLQNLLVAPFSQAQKMPHDLVVVIDAMDECHEDAAISLIIKSCFSLAAQLPIKFLITSRPEPMVYLDLVSQSDDVRSLFHLHEVKQDAVQQDIRTYLQAELESISPSEQEIDQLVTLAGRFFIYAATTVRYIGPKNRLIDSESRLEAIIQTGPVPGTMFTSLDALYYTVLARASENEALEPKDREDLKSVVWTVVCSEVPVPLNALCVLAGLKSDKGALTAITLLRSLLHISPGNIVSPFHASFPDFIFNPSRSKEFFRNKILQKQIHVLMCFRVMVKELRFNICRLESSYMPDQDVLDLNERIRVNISDHLSYACQAWGHHLSQVPKLDPAPEIEEIYALINAFLSDKLFFWMEVINLKGLYPQGLQPLHSLPDKLSHLCGPPHLNRLALEVSRFTKPGGQLPNRLISTPHIYTSIIPPAFQAHLSLANYRGRMQGLIKTDIHFAQRSHGHIQTQGSQSALVKPISITYSADGKCIAAAFPTGRISTWSTCTGELVGNPSIFFVLAPSEKLSSASFSPDLTQFAYGTSRGTIALRRLSDYERNVGPFKAHTSWVDTLVFSPDGLCIASSSRDTGVIAVWNAEDGSCRAGPFDDMAQGAKVVLLRFLRDGTQLVCGYDNGTIHVRGVDNRVIGSNTYTLRSGVTSMAVSSDCATLAAALHDGSIEIHDFLHSKLVAGPFHIASGPVALLEIAADKDMIAVASSDGIIRVIDTQKGTLLASPFKFCDTNVSAPVQFSPSGNQIAIIWGDNTGHILIWNTTSFGPTYSQPGESSELNPDTNRATKAPPALSYHVASPGGCMARFSNSQAQQISSTSRALPWDISNDGWVTFGTKVICWLPKPARRSIKVLASGCSLVISDSKAFEFDFKDALLGDDWDECYLDLR